MPVPLVWIRKPGSEGEWVARPAVRAVAEGAWSALAKSGVRFSRLVLVTRWFYSRQTMSALEVSLVRRSVLSRSP